MMNGALYKLAATITKEFRLLMRDREALLILFVMPVTFVVIMSLALQDAFSERAGIRFSVLIVNHDGGLVGNAIDEAFSKSSFFDVSAVPPGTGKQLPDETAVRKDLVAGKYKFAVLIPPAATQRSLRRIQQRLGLAPVHGTAEQPVDISLLADPTMQRDHRDLVAAALNRMLQRIESRMVLEQFKAFGQRITAATRGVPGIPVLKAPASINAFAEVTDHEESAALSGAPIPTSVQQNAPAWTLLAMFFLVVPLSVTFIKERQQGSLARLQSMPVPAWVLLGGKIAPYFVINQIQVVLILLVGRYLLPYLGGDALDIGHAPQAIMLVSMSASLAAVGYGLLVATFARTPEQATTFGATSVLVLAAIGGVMVPKLVMPAVLQRVANLSPLSWGLDGFLDIFVRGGGTRDVLPTIAKLLTFAAACLALAVFRFRHTLRRG